MATKSIYLDESGFTGTNLLDPTQPFFCVASTDFSDVEADGILRAAFPNYRGEEFKFGALWRRERTREGMRSFSGAVGTDPDRVFVWLIDKRFCVLTKLVDFIVEPLLYDMGYDFYQDQLPPRFCNWVHFSLVKHKKLYDRALEVYDRLARFPSAESLAEARLAYATMARRAPKSIRWFFEWLQAGVDRFEEFHALDSFADSSEIQLTSVLASISYWRQRSGDEIAVKHDQSNNFFSQAEIWGKLTSPAVPAQELPTSGSGPIPFPLRVTSTSAVLSHESAAIQLCDVLAGLVNKSHQLRIKPADPFVEQLLEGGLGKVTMNGVYPRPEFPLGPPARRTGPDAVDRMTSIIFGA
jgi:hypothetical protein